MLKRTISALIGAPLLLGLTYLGGSYTAFLVAILTVLALWEFLRIGEHMGIRPWYKIATIGALIWLCVVFWGNKDLILPMLILWLIFTLGRLALQYPGLTIHEVGYNFLALIYSVVLLSHLYLLRQLPQGIKWTFMTFFLVWATDTGAYLIGRAVGRHRLAPQVSPKKTVEGSIGGLLFGSLTGLVFWYRSGGSTWTVFLALALIVGITAQIGDLFESALKRSAGVKDSGHLIPGHGGILDRFDSFVFALPLVYYFLLFNMMG